MEGRVEVALVVVAVLSCNVRGHEIFVQICLDLSW